MSKCYVKAYYDWIEQTAALSDAERGRLFIAILEYARSGREPKLDGRESLLFPVFQCMVDRDNEKSAVLAGNGAKGGRGNKAIESKSKQTKANESKTKPIHKTQDIRHKTQEEDYDKDNNIPPIAPQKGAGAADFVLFWSAYPKKADKPAAERAWKKLKPDAELLKTMLSAIDRQEQSDAWTREEGRFIPNPATWLNGQRWLDEPPQVATDAPKNPGKSVAAQQYAGQRSYSQAEYDALFMDLNAFD